VVDVVPTNEERMIGRHPVVAYFLCRLVYNLQVMVNIDNLRVVGYSSEKADETRLQPTVTLTRELDEQLTLTGRSPRDVLADTHRARNHRPAGFRFSAVDADLAGSGGPLIIAFLDIVGLKGINDSLGHAAGDRALQALAGVVRHHLRSHDIVLRYGGDEFVCALSGVSFGRVTAVRRCQPGACRRPEHVTVTIGVSELQAGESVESAVARADRNPYSRREQRTQ